MELKQVNTENMILEAAERLFIQKGYAGTRCMEIAEAAGVNHAMLHYYFRTKDSLFNRIFEQKAAQLLEFFVAAFDSDLPFLEKVKMGIERHFDFIAQDPELPFFVLREFIQDEERKKAILQKMLPVGMEVLKRMSFAIREEYHRGNIRFIKAQDLLLNIASLNIFTFVALQIFFDVSKDRDKIEYRNFLEERKRNNVEVIIKSLKK